VGSRVVLARVRQVLRAAVLRRALSEGDTAMERGPDWRVPVEVQLYTARSSSPAVCSYQRHASSEVGKQED
jgi:hypothetical protein